MSTKTPAALVAAAISISACSSTPTARPVGASIAHHRVAECAEVAPTGSRIKTHVECGDRGGYGKYKIRTWADIERERQ